MVITELIWLDPFGHDYKVEAMKHESNIVITYSTVLQDNTLGSSRYKQIYICNLIHAPIPICQSFYFMPHIS